MSVIDPSYEEVRHTVLLLRARRDVAEARRISSH
jgi:hypothetical protein